MEFDMGMTDNQFEKYNKLIVFIRKILKLIPADKRQELEDELDTILN